MADPISQTGAINKQARMDNYEYLSRFYYALYKHCSWSPRRVNRWTFEGRSVVRQITVDIDKVRIGSYFDECLSSGNRNIDASSNDFEEIKKQYLEGKDLLLVPLFDQSKNEYCYSFDLRDAANNAVKLVPRSSASYMCTLILMGALLMEDDTLERIDKDRYLWEFIRSLFDLEDELTATNGKVPDYSSANFEAEFRFALEKAIRFYISRISREGGLNQDSLSYLHNKFFDYYDRSRVFNFFIQNYTFKRLMFAQVDLHTPTTNIIKCRYEIPAGVLVDNYPSNRFGYVAVTIPIDDMDFSEVNRIHIVAPEGTSFVSSRHRWRPERHIKDQDGQTDGAKIKPESFFLVCNEAIKINDSGEIDAETSSVQEDLLEAKATFSEENVVIKARTSWSDGRKLKFFLLERANQRQIQIPLVLSPIFGLRVVAYTSFTLLAFAWCLSITFLGATFTLPNDAMSAGTFLAVLTLFVTYSASIKPLSYLQAEAFAFPRRLFFVSVFFFLTFLTLSGLSAYLAVSFEFLTMLLTMAKRIITFGILGLLIVLGVWLVSHSAARFAMRRRNATYICKKIFVKRFRARWK